MEKTECGICNEKHHDQADCVHILKGELHYARKKFNEMEREKNDLELVYSALKRERVSGALAV